MTARCFRRRAGCHNRLLSMLLFRFRAPKSLSKSLKNSLPFLLVHRRSIFYSHRDRYGLKKEITMPKERRDRSVSIGKSMFSPYQCSGSRTQQILVNNPLENEKSLKEWEDARCPVCIEPPHNAILLLCSSHNKGCRPYMCDTSYRHSNCFDQFRKSFSEGQLSGSTTEQSQPSISLTGDSQQSLTIGNNEKSKLVCPLCRGEVNGWVVVDPARLFMNTKTRSCACETCDFSGTYTDLRKHARTVHPFVRPSEVDPARQQDWRRMERQRDFGDLLSTLRSSIREEQGEDSTSELSVVDGQTMLTILFLIRDVQPRPIRVPVSSRTRSHLTVRRRRTTHLWGDGYDYEAMVGDVDGGFSDGEPRSRPGARRFFRISRRLSTPDADD
ncbi:hypothetical protein QVD17_03307 [Tagetes erecta]|uniref:Uncharacterized protein n=1 Tax=Tagetes erecta TaxID=13708 RepID=A0AAD8LHA2_TARER|nr:hypothetical protein QVD17_03307 [Tagetes erecta]